MNKTISIELIPELIENLHSQIKSSGFHPEIVLYIERAGKIFGEPIARKINCKSIGIKANRSSGNTKKVISKFIPFVPKKIIQLIKYVELKSNFNKINKNRNISIDFQLDHYSNILIVDDAIDSGETLYKIIDYINKDNAAKNIKIAVVTTSTNKPKVFPDFSIYNNTICNFPWSIDSEQYLKFIEVYGEYYR